jgi:hypothetical protein
MARLVGWALVEVGLLVAAVSATPFVFVIMTSGDPTINPARQGVLMAVGGFVGLLAAAVGGSVLFRERRGTWPLGF